MKTLQYASLLLMIFAFNTSFKSPLLINRTFAGKNTYIVLINKKKYELKLFDSTGEWLATYPVVFGNKDLGDKMIQGDRKTPEGTFHIISKRKHEKWCRMLMLDYPTKENIAKFNARKAKGMLPANAQIGGGIGIHGTWPHEEYAIDRYQNWTEGCISTKNNYIEELFDLLPVGTRVDIQL